MGHNVIYHDYPENVNRKAVQADMDHYAAMEDWQEGCLGVRPIRWLDSQTICQNSDEAETLIDKLDRGNYDCLAVRYYENTPLQASKGSEKARNAVNEAQKAYNAAKVKIEAAFLGAKSEYVGCKECGSKLKRSLLKKTNCPLCGRNLLSETDTTRLMNAHDRIVNAQKKQKEFIGKEQKKAEKAAKNRKVRWLVKVEYHT